MGPSYKVNVLTGSALADPQFAYEAAAQFNDNQSGMLTNSGGDFLGKSSAPPPPFPKHRNPTNTPFHSMGKNPTVPPLKLHQQNPVRPLHLPLRLARSRIPKHVRFPRLPTKLYSRRPQRQRPQQQLRHRIHRPCRSPFSGYNRHFIR